MKFYLKLSISENFNLQDEISKSQVQNIYLKTIMKNAFCNKQLWTENNFYQIIKLKCYLNFVISSKNHQDIFIFVFLLNPQTLSFWWFFRILCSTKNKFVQILVKFMISISNSFFPSHED